VQERLRGYRDALAKGGIDAGSQVQLSGQFIEQFGMSALPHLLAAPEPRSLAGSPGMTAVWATSHDRKRCTRPVSPGPDPSRCDTSTGRSRDVRTATSRRRAIRYATSASTTFSRPPRYGG